MYFFILSLERVAMSWYYNLENDIRKEWDSLIEAFIGHYSYNTILDVSKKKIGGHQAK